MSIFRFKFWSIELVDCLHRWKNAQRTVWRRQDGVSERDWDATVTNADKLRQTSDRILMQTVEVFPCAKSSLSYAPSYPFYMIFMWAVSKPAPARDHVTMSTSRLRASCFLSASKVMISLKILSSFCFSITWFFGRRDHQYREHLEKIPRTERIFRDENMWNKSKYMQVLSGFLRKKRWVMV